MFNDKGLNLNLICSKTGQIFDMSASRIENKVIYTSCLDLPFKRGDQIVRTWEDGYEEQFEIIGLNRNKIWPRIKIDIK